jgi:hypothetical protein
VTTFVLLWAGGWSSGRAAAYAVAVPLAVSTGAALVLGVAFAGASVNFSERVARGRFALPVTAAAAGCVLASLWLLAPSGLAPLREQPGGTAEQALEATPPVREIPVPVAKPRRPAQAPTGTARVPRRTAPIAVTPRTPAGQGPVAGPVAAPVDVAGPGVRPPAAPPAVAPDDSVTTPRGRPATGFDRAGVDPPVTVRPDTGGADTVRKVKVNASTRKTLPGRRCGQRADHCRTPFGRAFGRRWR